MKIKRTSMPCMPRSISAAATMSFPSRAHARNYSIKSCAHAEYQLLCYNTFNKTYWFIIRHIALSYTQFIIYVCSIHHEQEWICCKSERTQNSKRYGAAFNCKLKYTTHNNHERQFSPFMVDIRLAISVGSFARVVCIFCCVRRHRCRTLLRIKASSVLVANGQMYTCEKPFVIALPIRR